MRLKLQEPKNHVNIELMLTQQIIHHIDRGVLFISSSGTISICNPAAEKLLSLKPLQIVEQNYWKLFSDDYFGFSMRGALARLHTPKKIVAAIQNKRLEIVSHAVLEGPRQGIMLFILDKGETWSSKKSCSSKKKRSVANSPPNFWRKSKAKSFALGRASAR